MMALRQGQRQVRLEADKVRAALRSLRHTDQINLDEEIVGASFITRHDAPDLIVLLVEEVEDGEEGA